MSLRRSLGSGVAAVAIAAAIATPIGAQPAGGLREVRVGEATTFTRLDLGPGVATRRDGATLTVTFPAGARPDLSRFRTSTPKWIQSARIAQSSGRTQLILTLAADADMRSGVADGAVWVNVFPRAAPIDGPGPAPVSPQEQASAPISRPDPLPRGGVVKAEITLGQGQAVLSFPFANPAGAAVFRRGGAIWVVFDAPARLDVSTLPRGLRQMTSVETFRGPDYAALRIVAPPAMPFRADSAGSTWNIVLGRAASPQGPFVRVVRDEAGGPAALKSAVAGATRVLRIDDPVVGDPITVVTALGPAKGAPLRREFAQVTVLPSSQGLALESFVRDLSVTHDGDIVRIGRPDGLALSPLSVGSAPEDAGLDAPRPAIMPALIDQVNWPETGSKGFLGRYNELLSAAADEAQGGRDAPTANRLALARFLVGSELSYEAIGILNDLARRSPQVLDNPEFRGLRGIARVMARRYAEAATDFSAPILTSDPSASLWRAYISAQLGQWTEVRNEFSAGAEAFNQFSPVWKSRFARAEGQAALAQGDLEGADKAVRLALADRASSAETLAARLLQARLLEAQGAKDRAVRIYQAVATAPLDWLSTPAALQAARIRLEQGKINAVQAADEINALRFRWRGDGTELEIIRTLGGVYLSQGRYREALETLRSAGRSLPDLPEAVQLQADLSAAFRTLFMDGVADGLQPVQALALFLDFKELTPLGADGDLMVRRLVGRLVKVDLLEQAAELLKYQTENRLEGAPKAQVATDLALIYLMDRKPEQALQAINNSRTTLLPPAMQMERRRVEARALIALNRPDDAIELLERDRSPEGEELRTEIIWRKKNWPAAASAFERSLGDRWRRPGALTSDEEGKLLRAGIAYSLAGDDAALTRLRTRYAGFIDQARNPDALRVGLTGLDSGEMGSADFSKVTADNEAFSGWVAKMRAKFAQAAPAPPPPPRPASPSAAPVPPSPARPPAPPRPA
ncbi:endoglucanase [Phenylobacterium sp.]|uniref:endoglucanase n=1 Tax=Phenylobacterium sp. TaxID=1871053 RepID=UPI0025FE7B84|nr:endoglucanase [Phenylobacterium sp.]